MLISATVYRLISCWLRISVFIIFKEVRLSYLNTQT